MQGVQTFAWDCLETLINQLSPHLITQTAAASKALQGKFDTLTGPTRRPALSAAAPDAEELARRRERAARFEPLGPQPDDAPAQTLVGAREGGSERGVAYGTSSQLEREYLRLTRLPALSEVRPPAVLEQSLELVKSKWLEVRGLMCQERGH